MKYNKFSLLAVLVASILGTSRPALSDSFTMNGKPISENEAKAVGLVKDSMQSLDGGNVKEALKIAQEANALAPDFYYVTASLGVCQARAGLSDDAIASFRKALSLNPDLPDSMWSLAATLQSAGRTEEAVAEFKMFVAKFPTNSRAAQGKAFISLMDGHGNKVKTHNSDDYFDEAIGNNPVSLVEREHADKNLRQQRRQDTRLSSELRQ